MTDQEEIDWVLAMGELEEEAGGFVGAGPMKSFKVTCDETNNTQIQRPTSRSWRDDAEALLAMGAQMIDAGTVRGLLADEKTALNILTAWFDGTDSIGTTELRTEQLLGRIVKVK